MHASCVTRSWRAAPTLRVILILILILIVAAMSISTALPHAPHVQHAPRDKPCNRAATSVIRAPAVRGQDGLKCTWGDSRPHVVIDAATLHPPHPWTASPRGVTWRAGNTTHRIDRKPKASSGQLFVTVFLPRSGTYLLTAVVSSRLEDGRLSSSFWLRFTGGLQTLRTADGRVTAAAAQPLGNGAYWHVALPTCGLGKLRTLCLVGDQHGFAFVTRRVVGSQFYQIVIAGRSASLTIETLLMVACEGNECDPKSEHIQRVLHKRERSPCSSTLLQSYFA